jgi:hypothetical protein
MKIKFLFVFLPLCLLSMGTSGQNRKAVHIVKGTVIERATKKPLGGVSVWCHDDKEVSKLINVQYTKADGSFE